jgi:hypothetical protein
MFESYVEWLNQRIVIAREDADFQKHMKLIKDNGIYI